MKKSLEAFTKYLWLWTILAAALGFYFPNALLPLKPNIDWLFALTMFGIGAVLNYEDFIPIFTQPRLTLLGTLAQFVIMPLLGFLTAKLFNFPPALFVGFVLTGTVPGAMASTVISYLAKADVAYSVALTTTTTILSPILTPTFTFLLAKAVIKVDYLGMFISIIQMVIVPLIIGFFLKKYFSKAIKSIEPVFPAFSTLFIALICGLVVALNRDYVAKASLIVIVAIIIFNAFGLLLGYFAGYLYGFDYKRKRTLAFEVGMQNAGLGVVLSLKHFSNLTALVPAIFASWCIITASILAEYWSRHRPTT